MIKSAALQSMKSYWLGPDGKFNLLEDNEAHVDAIPRIAKQYGIKNNRFTKRQITLDEDNVFEEFLETGFVRFFNGFTTIVISKSGGSIRDVQISAIMDHTRPGANYYVTHGQNEDPIETSDLDTLRSVLMGNKPSSMEMGRYRAASTKLHKKAQEDQEEDNLWLEEVIKNEFESVEWNKKIENSKETVKNVMGALDKLLGGTNWNRTRIVEWLESVCALRSGSVIMPQETMDNVISAAISAVDHSNINNLAVSCWPLVQAMSVLIREGVVTNDEDIFNARNAYYRLRPHGTKDSNSPEANATLMRMEMENHI